MRGLGSRGLGYLGLGFRESRGLGFLGLGSLGFRGLGCFWGFDRVADDGAAEDDGGDGDGYNYVIRPWYGTSCGRARAV